MGKEALAALDFLELLAFELGGRNPKPSESFLRQGAWSFYEWGQASPHQALHCVEAMAESAGGALSGLMVASAAMAYMGAEQALGLESPWRCEMSSENVFNDEGEYELARYPMAWFIDEIAKAPIAGFGSLRPEAVNLLSAHGTCLLDDWIEETSGLSNAAEFHAVAAELFVGRLHERLAESSAYDLSCSKEDCAKMVEAVSIGARQETLEREIEPAPLSKSGPRL